MTSDPSKPALVLSACLLLALADGLQANDWPQWRGPARTDLSTESGLLRSWPEGGPKRLWLFENAGLGYSGPSIVDGKLYTMGVRDAAEMLLAIDAESGKELWAAKVGSVYKEGHGNGPRATPTVDGDRVYAMGGQGTLICAKRADGKVLWSRNMEELGGSQPHWGYTESVLVEGDRVACTPGGSKGAIAALDKMTGKVVWQSAGFTDDAQYASMIPIDYGGIHQYVQLTMKSVVGIEAKTGKLLWRSEWPGKTAVIPTPIFNDGLVYVSSGYGVGCKEVKLGPNNEASDVFENKVMKNHHGGVILVDGFLYGYSDSVGWVCQNFRSGKEIWSSKELGKGAVAYADGMLYCVDESTGKVALIEASSLGWKLHGQFTLEPQSPNRAKSGKVWTHPVILNGKLYLRDQENIYCYDVRNK